MAAVLKIHQTGVKNRSKKTRATAIMLMRNDGLGQGRWWWSSGKGYLF